MQLISATVITFNEEHNIREALQSLSWADEIVIVDSGSRDATLEICRNFTDKIFHRGWTGYVDQKNPLSARRAMTGFFPLMPMNDPARNSATKSGNWRSKDSADPDTEWRG
jgi:hypothetical protein